MSEIWYLKKQIEHLNVRLRQADAALTYLSGQLSVCKDDKRSLQAEIDKLEGEIKDLKARLIIVNPPKKRYIQICRQDNIFIEKLVGAVTQDAFDYLLKHDSVFECPLLTEPMLVDYDSRDPKTGEYQRVDPIRIADNVRKYVKEDAPYATLDLESWFLRDLFRWMPGWIERDPRSMEAERQMKIMLDVAQSVRPNTEWSIWAFVGIPGVDNHSQWADYDAAKKAEYLRAAGNPADLINQVGALLPAVYDFQKSDKGFDKHHVYVRDLIGRCLELHQKVGASIWHRVFTTNWLITSGWAIVMGGTEFSIEEWMRDQIIPSLEAGAQYVQWWSSDVLYTNQHNLDPGDLTKFHIDYGEALIDTVTNYVPVL